MGSLTFTAQVNLSEDQSMFMGPAELRDLQAWLVAEAKASLPEGLGGDGIFIWSQDYNTNTRTLRYEYVLEDVDI